MGSTDPILVALVVGIVTLIGNMVVSFVNNRNTIAQAKLKAKSDLDLEDRKAKYSLILQAIATDDPAAARRNIEFFIGSGLLDDSKNAIRGALQRYNPVLPSASGTAPATRAVLPSDIAELYNFPPNLDGSGQVVGMLEFGGGFRPAEIVAYFASTGQPAPEIIEVSIAGAKNSPGDTGASARVSADIQLVGGIAPKAQLRVYFAPFDVEGWTAALDRSVADGVGILLVGWGKPESQWEPADLEAVDRALAAAAKRGVTIISAAGNQGVAPTSSRRRDVMFPAASSWVLAVGGTAMESTSDGVGSEVVWNEPAIGATGGGVSRVFERPVWQLAIETPRARPGAFAGRAIPDVSAAAWRTMTMIGIGGVQTPLGGTGMAAGVWAGLIARVNQGLGRNVGYLNPLLYQRIGPAGVLRPITKGHNGWRNVKGYTASRSWSAAAGWGVPDGEKLLEWLRENH